MAGEVEDAEARDLVALGDGAVDLHRAAVPAPQQQRVDPARRATGSCERFHIGGDRGIAFGVGDVVGMAEDRHAHRRRGAAVVGVGVAEHDPLQPAELLGRRLRLP